MKGIHAFLINKKGYFHIPLEFKLIGETVDIFPWHKDKSNISEKNIIVTNTNFVGYHSA